MSNFTTVGFPEYSLNFTFNGIGYGFTISGFPSNGVVEDVETILTEIGAALTSLHQDEPGFGPTIVKGVQRQATLYAPPLILDNSNGGFQNNDAMGSIFMAPGDFSLGVQLSTAPADDVTVTVTASPSDPVNGSLSATPASLTFTSANWNTTQTVTVTLSSPTTGFQPVGTVLMTADGYGADEVMFASTEG